MPLAAHGSWQTCENRLVLSPTGMLWLQWIPQTVLPKLDALVYLSESI